MQIPKFLMSSVDAEKLALTIKGILVGAIPVIMMIANFSHLNLGQADLNAFVDGFCAALQAILYAISAVMIMIGLARKILVGIGLIKVNN